MDFLDWFTYSDNTIDGQSRKKAYTLWESNLVADKDVGKVKALQQIHAYLFGGLYDFAGKIRTKTISKGNTLFCLAEYLHQNLKTIEQMPETVEKVASQIIAAIRKQKSKAYVTKRWHALAIINKNLPFSIYKKM